MKKFIVRVTEDSQNNGWDVLEDNKFKLFRDAKKFALEQEQALQRDWQLISRQEKRNIFKCVFKKGCEIRTLAIIKN
nr:MAG TPA: hypothetical protein [Caudoviricetes sp.]